MCRDCDRARLPCRVCCAAWATGQARSVSGTSEALRTAGPPRRASTSFSDGTWLADAYSHRYYQLGSPPGKIFHDLWRNGAEVFEEPAYMTEVLGWKRRPSHVSRAASRSSCGSLRRAALFDDGAEEVPDRFPGYGVRSPHASRHGRGQGRCNRRSAEPVRDPASNAISWCGSGR